MEKLVGEEVATSAKVNRAGRADSISASTASKSCLLSIDTSVRQSLVSVGRLASYVVRTEESPHCSKRGSRLRRV